MTRCHTSSLTAGMVYAMALVLSAVAFAPTVQSQNGDCHPCQNLKDSYGEELLDRVVDVPQLGQQTCRSIRDALPLFLTQGSEECSLFQSIGTLCGCPAREDACGLCHVEGCDNDFDHRAVVSLTAKYESNCEIASNFLRSLPTNSSECSKKQAEWSAACGCCRSTPDDTDGDSSPDSSESADPLTTDNKARCTLCEDPEDKILYPERSLMSLFGERGASSTFGNAIVDLLGGNNLTCQMADSAFAAAIVPTQFCWALERKFLAGLCGCPARKGACDFCPTDDVSKPDRIFALAEG